MMDTDGIDSLGVTTTNDYWMSGTEAARVLRVYTQNTVEVGAR